MERVQLSAESRSVHGKKVKQLRNKDLIPAVVYGPDMAPQTIQVNERDMSSALQRAGATALIDLLIDSEKEPNTVLARDIQRDILTSRLQHVDFYKVRLTEKVRITPRLELVGEAPAVRSGEAVLLHSMTEVDIECLPTDLVDLIEVDISNLEKLGQTVVVSDLPVPSGVTILADPDEVVVSLVSPRIELEVEEPEVELEGEPEEEEAEVEVEVEEEE
jgi:large subunit ribosomal protein L25